jgi:hypothetical protein
VWRSVLNRSGLAEKRTTSLYLRLELMLLVCLSFTGMCKTSMAWRLRDGHGVSPHCRCSKYRTKRGEARHSIPCAEPRSVARSHMIIL